MVTAQASLSGTCSLEHWLLLANHVRCSGQMGTEVLDQNSSQTEPSPLLAGQVESGLFGSILQQGAIDQSNIHPQVCTEHDFSILCNADDRI